MIQADVSGLFGKEIYHKIADNIETVMKGQTAAIRKLLAALPA